MKTDIQIAQEAQMMPIKEVAAKAGLTEDDLELYGKYKAKLSDEYWDKIKENPDGKLVLVTAINPTPAGEGKTTTTVGLGQAMAKLNKNAIIALREPSLGPCFGIKGGAAGGGYAQVVPMEDLNLHFTGDFHAITTANNLISAAIDNHIYFGNSLQLDTNRICFRRCMDMNDRALREVNLHDRKEHFNITAASEMMSILCLSSDFKDLKKRLANILLAYNIDGKPVYAKELKLEGALATILKDAIKPNLVQTLECNPVIIHGGPFANIAHGCNSVIATKLGLNLADYVVTEAGFGSDLGAEKFLDIKCRSANLKPDCIVIVATIKALKYNAGVLKEDILKENVEALRNGICNLGAHIENMKLYTKNIVVTLNRYDTDTEEEIDFVKQYVTEQDVNFAVNDSYRIGGQGAISLAEQVVTICNQENDFEMLYESSSSIWDKIEMITTKIYHANQVNYSDEAKKKIQQFEQLGYGHYPVCIAKTQYSLSDNPNLLGSPTDYGVMVRDANIYTGAGFIVIYLGTIMTMPGLSKHPNYENIEIDDDYQIKGLF